MKFSFQNWLYVLLFFCILEMKFSLFFNTWFFVPYWLNLNNYGSLVYEGLSLKLIFLVFWVFIFSILTSLKIFNLFIKSKLFLIIMLILSLISFMCFLSSNMLLLYFFFESSILPMIFLIMIWGYQPERLNAINYLFFYTVICSMPFFGVMLYLWMTTNSLNLFLSFYLDHYLSNFLKYMFLFLFLVKCPIYLLHLWLPKAHVEAPVSGSIILAAILLKFGSYGLLRLIEMNFLMKLNIKILMSIFVWGSLMTCIICIRQIDVKSLIAYSSVSHMSILCASLLSLSFKGMISSILMMLTHGLTSMSMFILANYYYESFLTRSIFLNTGILNFLPMMSVWMFMICSSNSSVPPFVNFYIELWIMMAILSMSFQLFLLLLMIGLLTLIYMFLLYFNSQYGENNSTKIFNENYLMNMAMFLSIFPLILSFF